MKKMLRFILFMSILGIILLILELLLIQAPNMNVIESLLDTNFEIIEEKNDTIDVIFLGDSLVYSSISPMEIWNEYGYTSFDCAEAAQIIPNAYKYLEFAIKTQHPKIVVMEANVIFRDPNKRDLKYDISYFAKKIAPIRQYHDYWKKYIDFGSKENWVNVNKGFRYIVDIKPSKNKKYMKKTKKYNDIPKENISYLDDIIKLCNENDIKLVLVSLPTQVAWKYKKHNTTDKIAKENNLDFIDFNLLDLGIDWEKETKDSGEHLNLYGAKKVSSYLGKYLKDTKMLIDHREDSKYDDWHKAYKEYSKE